MCGWALVTFRVFYSVFVWKTGRVICTSLDWKLSHLIFPVTQKAYLSHFPHKIALYFIWQKHGECCEQRHPRVFWLIPKEWALLFCFPNFACNLWMGIGYFQGDLFTAFVWKNGRVICTILGWKLTLNITIHQKLIWQKHEEFCVEKHSGVSKSEMKRLCRLL